jgi:glycosyltransferase involved in cell wall biosynthesis
LDEIQQAAGDPAVLQTLNLPAGVPLVINARGFRPGSVRNDTFFRAIPHVLEQAPHTCFVCPAMAGESEAEHWISRLGMPGNLHLLPVLPQRQLWQLFKLCTVFVSPSAHDGTPNSLLEAMACGCFPVAGDIESLRQWITPGVNGLLVDPDDPKVLAEAILLALNTPQTRQSAAQINASLVDEKANSSRLTDIIINWYHSVIA